MYAFVDRLTEDLCDGSRFLLWAMRAWTHAVERRLCPPHALAAAFSHMGLLRMLPEFHMAMALLNRDRLAKLAFAPISHTRVLEDEAVLLALWREATLGQAEHSAATLALLIEEASISAMVGAISAGASKLRETGLAPLGPGQTKLKEA